MIFVVDRGAPPRATVLAAWPKFIAAFEGRIPTMYMDTLNYVTFGVGRKIEEFSTISDYGLTRPWRDIQGGLVLESAIRSEFTMINRHTELSPKGGAAFEAVATLHINGPDIDEALLDTTATFWEVMVRTLPDASAWPADAQVALLNMGYNLGPNFLGSRWPRFTAAAKAGDFAACADSCSTANHTTRDHRNALLFRNAARVHFAGLDPDRLYDSGVPMISIGGIQPALLVLSAAAVAVAPVNVVKPAAWYAQRMLSAAGYYTTTCDGLFGTMSKAAFAAWANAANQPNTITQPTLQALSTATLRMPVST